MSKLLPSLIFVTLATLPSYLIRCKSFSWCNSPVPFTLLELLILLTFFCWFYLALQKSGNIHSLFTKISSLIPKNYQIFTLLFLAAAGINVLISPDKFGALGIYKAYFLEPVLLFIVVLDYLNETKNSWLVVLSLLTSGVLVGGYGLVEKFFHFNPGNLDEFLYRGRVSAFYTTSNAVALILGPLFYLALGSLLETEDKAKRVILGSYLVIIGVGLWASWSRAGLIAVLVAGIVFVSSVLITRFKKELWTIYRAIIPIFVGIILLINLLFLSNINQFLHINLEKNILPALNQRLCLWDGAVKLVTDRPLLGAGLNGYYIIDDKYRTCSQEQAQYPHNLILNFWIETGIFGLISFTGLFLLLVKSSLRVPSLVSLGLLAALVTILTHGLADVPYFKNDLSVEFWMIGALIIYFASAKTTQR